MFCCRKNFLLSFLILMLNVTSMFAAGTQDDSQNSVQDSAQETIVAVSILPQSYFVNRISGGTVKPLVLVGHGQDPHSYEPTPRQMMGLSKASVWILSGMLFEVNFVPKVKNLYPNLPLVDGTKGVKVRYMEEHGHAHDEYADHAGHANTAPEAMEIDHHTWLGKEPAKILARHVCETLKIINPASADLYQNNYEALISDIDEEFDRLTIALAPLKGSSVFVYHPSFGYFFDEFGIVQEAVESGGKEPSPRQITELMAKAQAEGVSVIFVQAEFPADTAKTIAASLGVEVFPLDALAEDWLANIRFMGDSLLQGIKK
jgi:zinc transport system substrate-binding protein